MSSLGIQIADAVTTSLNFSGLVLQAERKWRVFSELTEGIGTFVHVMPNGSDWQNRDRSGATVDVSVVIGVQRKIVADGSDPNPPEMQLDNAATLCEDIARHLHGKDQGPGRFLSVRQDPLWVPEHYEQWGQFTGFVEATYRCAVA